jgi:phosphoribosylanthranilate isomerase
MTKIISSKQSNANPGAANPNIIKQSAAEPGITNPIAAKQNITRPIIKICGLARASDAHLAASLGADMCGFIFHPSSRRCVHPRKVRDFDTLKAKRVGVFVDQDYLEILDIIDQAKLDMVQLHGDYRADEAHSLGPIGVIKVFWPTGQRLSSGEFRPDFQERLRQWEDKALYFLFDSGAGGGGHGTKITDPFFDVDKPYILAGGLSSKDIGDIWPQRRQSLRGFDFNSKIESAPAIKDHDKLKAIFDVLNNQVFLDSSLSV